MNLENLTTQVPSNIEHFSNIVNQVTFSWYDYILFTIMLSVSALIGVYFGCFGSKQATANEYLMGGKKMKIFPISMSLVASHISGITLLAVPADVYRFGAAYLWGCVGVLVVCVLTIYIFLPVFFKLQITSTYEYLEKRFDMRTRSFASFIYALSTFLYLPIVIYVPALAFSAATGINVHLITPLVCGVCIFYTTIGGLKAVVWTDTLQFTVTVGSVLTVFVLGINSAGGISAVLKNAADGKRLDLFDFDVNPTKRDSFFAAFIGISTLWTSQSAIHQSCVQKYLSLPTFREARISVIYFSIGIGLVSCFSGFTGLIIYSKYAHCDPFTTGEIARNDQLLPYYIMDVASVIPGLSGLFIAGVFCAALSTLSASLNCLAGTIYEDFICNWLGSRHTSEKTSSNILKLIVIITGIICTALVFIVEHLGGILPLALSLGGVTGGPLLAMFTLGVLFPKCSSKNAFYSSIIGLLFGVWVVVMAQYYKTRGLLVYESKPTSIDGCHFSNDTILNYGETNILNITNFIENATISNFSGTMKETTSKPFFLFRISHYYYSFLGMIVTMFSALILSFVLKNDDPPVHQDLLSPVIHSLLAKPIIVQKEHIEYNSIDGALQLVTKVTSNYEKEAILNNSL